MALFGNPLSALMDHRLQWLAKRTELITHNLASANLPKPIRRDLVDFKDLIKKRAQQDNLSPSNKTMHIDPMIITEGDIVKRPGEISADLEMLEMNQNSLEHEFMINVIKKFHQLIRTASSRVQN
jgi:flagellar basal body rod protein FlgB